MESTRRCCSWPWWYGLEEKKKCVVVVFFLLLFVCLFIKCSLEGLEPKFSDFSDRIKLAVPHQS